MRSCEMWRKSDWSVGCLRRPLRALTDKQEMHACRPWQEKVITSVITLSLPEESWIMERTCWSCSHKSESSCWLYTCITIPPIRIVCMGSRIWQLTFRESKNSFLSNLCTLHIWVCNSSSSEISSSSSALIKLLAGCECCILSVKKKTDWTELLYACSLCVYYNSSGHT